jgi:hypothetical protein
MTLGYDIHVTKQLRVHPKVVYTKLLFTPQASTRPFSKTMVSIAVCS